MVNRMTGRVLAALVAVAIVSVSAWAMDLAGAKAQGLVGEMPNGLIGVVRVEPGVEDFVKTVNAGRMKIYTQNATEQGVPVEQVQAIAGKKLQSATPSGQYIQDDHKAWVKK